MNSRKTQRRFIRTWRLKRSQINALLFALVTCCISLRAADTTNSVPSDKHLVEITFAMDDKPLTQMGHAELTLYISEHNRGFDRFIYSWADQGGESPDPATPRKAAQCLKLLKSVDEPKKLPDSPNQIVYVGCADGDKHVVKKFSIDQVPDEIHQMLTVMGFAEKEFTRLKFVKKT